MGTTVRCGGARGKLQEGFFSVELTCSKLSTLDEVEARDGD